MGLTNPISTLRLRTERSRSATLPSSSWTRGARGACSKRLSAGPLLPRRGANAANARLPEPPAARVGPLGGRAKRALRGRIRCPRLGATVNAGNTLNQDVGYEYTTARSE